MKKKIIIGLCIILIFISGCNTDYDVEDCFREAYENRYDCDLSTGCPAIPQEEVREIYVICEETIA